MTLPDIESEALKLPRDQRARLAEALLESLDQLSDDESERLWVVEAQRRDRDLDEGREIEIPSADVFRKLRARLS